MISEKDLEQEYIANNIGTIMKNIKENNYDYNGEYHDELKWTLEYLISLNVIKWVQEYCKHVRNIVLDESYFNEISNSGCIFTIASNTGIENREKLENVVVTSGNAERIYYFALVVKDANIEKLEDGIIATGNAEYIYKFAFKIKGINVEKLENGIIATKNAEYIYFFAMNIKGANTEKLEDGIIATKDANCIYRFAINVKGANIERLEDAIIATKNVFCIYEFARYVKGANIKKLEDAVIVMNDAKPKYIYFFARDVEGANIERLEDAIIATKNAEYIYFFARDVKGANIERLEDGIIATKNVFYIYLFGTDVKNANISKLETAMNNANNLKFIAAFKHQPKYIHEDLETEFSYFVSERLKKAEDEVFSSIINSGNIGRYIFNSNLFEGACQVFIDYLFRNIDKGNNSIILRIYYEMLKNPNIKEEDVDALDLEYKNYIMQNNEENNQGNVLKLKRFTDKKE